MDVKSAVTAYKKYITPYADKGVQLGSPAVTSAQGQKDKGVDKWLIPFLKECSQCKINFIALHYYDTTEGVGYPDNAIAFKKYIAKSRQDIMDATGIDYPIWITEIGVLKKSAQTKDHIDFLEDVTKWLGACLARFIFLSCSKLTIFAEEQEYVKRYAWFAAEKGDISLSRMVTEGGALNELGKTYNAYKALA